MVCFAWLTLWTFLRIGTNPRVFEHPLSTSEAETLISSWLAQPATGILDPGECHWEVLRGLVREGQAGGHLSWMLLSPQLRWNMAPRFTRQTATSRGLPGLSGPILSPLAADASHAMFGSHNCL